MDGKDLKEVTQGDFLSKLVFNLKLTWRLFWDKDVKFKYKLIPIFMVAYVVLPFDLVPEGILGAIGLVDDFIVVQQSTQLFFNAVKSGSKQAYSKHYHELREREI
jgi:uncharacterized membrane protein YkvA (DUF1232 family)